MQSEPDVTILGSDELRENVSGIPDFHAPTSPRLSDSRMAGEASYRRRDRTDERPRPSSSSAMRRDISISMHSQARPEPPRRNTGCAHLGSSTEVFSREDAPGHDLYGTQVQISLPHPGILALGESDGLYSVGEVVETRPAPQIRRLSRPHSP